MKNALKLPEIKFQLELQTNKFPLPLFGLHTIDKVDIRQYFRAPAGFELLFDFYSQDLVSALHSLGISPTEQEVIDMQNEVEKKGKIFFPDFCKLSLRKFREFDENHFRQELFKVIIILIGCWVF